MTVDLATWLKDALDEDERVAKAAQPGPWTVFQHGDTGGSVGSSDARGVAHRRDYDDYARYETGEWLDYADAVHIARWDPARVLAEVAAKRELLAIHRCTEAASGLPAELWDCDECGSDWPCRTVHLLAAPYTSRPGFDPSWLD